MKKTLLIILILIQYSCDRVDKKLIIQNNTNDTVFYLILPQRKIPSIEIPFFYYRDPKGKYIFEDCLLINEEKKCPIINDLWENYINRLPDGKLKIMFFKKQLLDTTKWERIIKEQLFSKLIERDVEDLKITNWVVKYDSL
jgi:hypothetical protein